MYLTVIEEYLEYENINYENEAIIVFFYSGI